MTKIVRGIIGGFILFLIINLVIKQCHKNDWFNQSQKKEERRKEIIDEYPQFWTKKDFRGEGVNNSIKILTRHETERPGLKFRQTGKGTLAKPNGENYVGELKNGKYHGKGTLNIAEGKYVGEWKDDKRHGQGTHTLAIGDK